MKSDSAYIAEIYKRSEYYKERRAKRKHAALTVAASVAAVIIGLSGLIICFSLVRKPPSADKQKTVVFTAPATPERTETAAATTAAPTHELTAQPIPEPTPAIDDRDLANYTIVKGVLSDFFWLSVQELIDRSDLILIGEPLYDITYEKTVFKYFTNQYTTFPLLETYYTPRSIKILRMIKGNIDTDQMKIAEFTAVINEEGKKEIWEDEFYSMARKGYKYLFFLRKSDKDDIYYIIGIQGKYNIDGTDLKEAEESAKRAENVNSYKSEILQRFDSDIKAVLAGPSSSQ